MGTFRIPRRVLAVAAAVALVTAGAAVAGGASTDECTPPTDQSSLVQQTAWQECRLDRIDVALDGLTKPAVTTTVTETVTAPPTTDTPTSTATTTSATATATQPTTATTTPTTTATATPTPTTTTPAGACVGAANTPGGPDPWGGCWPGEQSTGYPKGLPGDTREPVTLTAYTGPMTITAPDTVIDSKTINGDLRIKTTGVIVKRSMINGDVRIDGDDSGYSFRIEDSEVDAGRALGQDAYDGTSIGSRDFVAVRVHVHGGKRGANCASNCTIQDSYVHGQAEDKTGYMHESGVRMGERSTIVGNALTCDAKDYPPDAGCSGALTGYGDFAAVRDNTISKNLIMASISGYCAYGGSTRTKPYSDASGANIKFTDNVFQRGTVPGQWGKPICAYWGPITDFDGSKPGAVWTGNRYDDGTPIPLSYLPWEDK